MSVWQRGDLIEWSVKESADGEVSLAHMTGMVNGRKLCVEVRVLTKARADYTDEELWLLADEAAETMLERERGA